MAHEYRTQRRMEFADTDMAGIVHFSRYPVFMETAEHEFLRSVGTDIEVEWNGDRISWPRVAVSCDYRKPARYGDVLDIHVTVKRIGSKSITYEFVFSKDGVETARGQITAVCCVVNHGEDIRAIPIPDFISERLEQAPSTE